MPLAQEVLKIFMPILVLTNFALDIFIFKAIYSFIPVIYEYGSGSKLLNCTHFCGQKLSVGHFAYRWYSISFKKEWLKNK